MISRVFWRIGSILYFWVHWRGFIPRLPSSFLAKAGISVNGAFEPPVVALEPSQVFSYKLPAADPDNRDMSNSSDCKPIQMLIDVGGFPMRVSKHRRFRRGFQLPQRGHEVQHRTLHSRAKTYDVMHVLMVEMAFDGCRHSVAQFALLVSSHRTGVPGYFQNRAGSPCCRSQTPDTSTGPVSLAETSE